MHRLPDTPAERCAPASIEVSQYLLYLRDSPEPLHGANHTNDANDSIYRVLTEPGALPGTLCIITFESDTLRDGSHYFPHLKTGG